MITAPHAQRGGTLLGLILGLVIGLGAAVAVALYVSKVPVPFVDRLPQRTADQDAAEAERNKRWNPNAPLSGKAGAGTNTGVNAGTADASEPEASRPRARAETSPSSTGGTAVGAGGIPPPAATLPSAGSTSSPSAAGSPATPSAAAPRAADGRNDLTGLFIQAGAYGRPEDAEQQRAKLAMLGFSARISERDQGGRLMYRVRVGPYETREETQGPMDRLMGAGIEVSLVRVERSPTP